MLLPFFEWCEATAIGQAIRESLWLFPVIEAKLALGWYGKLTDRIALSIVAGYRFQQWFNVQGTMQFPDDVTDTVLINKRSDIGLHGPFGTAKITF